MECVILTRIMTRSSCCPPLLPPPPLPTPLQAPAGVTLRDSTCSAPLGVVPLLSSVIAVDCSLGMAVWIERGRISLTLTVVLVAVVGGGGATCE